VQERETQFTEREGNGGGVMQMRWTSGTMGTAVAVASVVAALGCSPQEKGQMARETARASGATVDTGGSAATIYRADSGRVPGTHMDTRLEAPTQIPALQQRLDSLERDPGYLERTSYGTGYVALLADAIEAMGSDIRRVGATNPGDFIGLGDQVLKEVGPTTGGGRVTLDRKDVPQHVAKVRRLIAIYEQTTHAPLNPSAQPPRADRSAGAGAAGNSAAPKR
jgi:hypothetical protein